MSNFPSQLDDDSTLPRVDADIIDIGPDAINSLRSAMFAVEANIGINAQGSTGSISQFLSVSFNPNGTIKPSSLTGIGLVILPITDIEISSTASIQESKLNLTYSTSSLYTLILTLQNSIDVLNGFLSLTGVKLEPHIDGTNYNHFLSAIRVDQTTAFVKTNPTITPSPGTNIVNRNTTNADLLLKNISDDLTVHEKSDGSIGTTAISGGTVPPENYAHMGSGIYVIPNNFSTIPQSNNNVQSIMEYIDSSSLLLLGSRTQNLYSNGISRTSRSSSFLSDGYGEPLVPPTPAVAYFLNEPPGPMASSPVDDFSHGDDVILFNPTSQQLSSFNFDAQFAQVRPGDLITINYGTGVSYQFLVDSTKSKIVGTTRTYAVRINGKNPVSDANAIARIDRSLFHRGKYGVLASARSPNYTNDYESLIISSPKAATALGNGFDQTKFDSSHYNLYLYLLPAGNTSNILPLPAIDITTNQGKTPGQYNLNNIINNINIAFRAPGFNYRFIAFQYNGQIGIMLADPYNNASFSIVSGTVDGYGNYTSSSLAAFPNNVVDNFNGIDPLGFGANGAGVASPPPSLAYATMSAAFFNPTLLFYPLKRNFFYTNGVERDSLKSDPIVLNNSIDNFGDGYWPATILPSPGTQVLPTRVEVVYQVNLDLTGSGLKPGKTIVIQPTFALSDSRYNFRDYGRFTIKNISFNNCNCPSNSLYTNITVYDGVHAAGTSPAATSMNIPVNLYFSDDSVSFDAENVFDTVASGPFKRFFETYVDGNGHTFTHERARFINTSSDIANINMYNVSPKIKGYTTNNDKEIRLTVSSYDQTTGIYVGFLSKWDPINLVSTNFGPITTGKKGEITRFYDESNIDYIDFTFDINASINSFLAKTIDIQLFLTLELDQEVMLLSTCQIDDITKQVSYLRDKREFGNVSEEQFSTSAIDFISATDRLLQENGVVSGFDNVSNTTSTITFNGGTAFINGKIILINQTTIDVPAIIETLSPAFSTTIPSITWFVCVNSKSEIELIASTDYSPSLSGTYGSLDQNRIFYVNNPVSNLNYPIRGTYLNNLLSNYTDVIPLYIATSTVSGTTISTLTVVDARRFISTGYSGITNSFIVSQEGQFRSVNAVDTWISQFTKYISYTNISNNFRGSNVDVRGNLSITSNITLSYPIKVLFNGNDGILNFGSNVVGLVNNLRFSDLTINAASSTLTIGTNVEFINCILNFPASLPALGGNVSFTNCTISFLGAAPTTGANTTFKNCVINTTAGLITGSNTIFDTCTITILSSVATGFILGNSNSFKNCTLNIPCAIGFTLGSNTTSFDGCTVNYTYDATSDGSFVPAPQIANTAKGCMFYNITPTTNLNNVSITNCSFISSSINRFSFISILFSATSCFADNVKINSNKYYTTYSGNDRGAVIAFVAPAVASTSMTGPRLTNCFIENNYCNKDQMIMISSIPNGSAIQEVIVGVNVRVIGNICGAVNVLTKRDTPLTTYTGSNPIEDKEDETIISQNTCKFIYSGFADGFVVDASDHRVVNNIVAGIFTGSLLIEDNVCSFIHTGVRLSSTIYTNGMPLLKIRHNKMAALDTTSVSGFLAPYYRNFTNIQIAIAILIDRISGI